MSTTKKKISKKLCGACPQWRVCVLISQNLCIKQDWFSVAKACIDGGAGAIQLREKNLDGAELLSRACKLVDLCSLTSVDVIINDRLDIALLSGADGVHLGQSDIPVKEARKMVEHCKNPPQTSNKVEIQQPTLPLITDSRFLIGVSTANLKQAKQALEDGADYCGLGPVFPSTTKKKKNLAGIEYLKEYVAWDKKETLPHLAISGINTDNIDKIKQAGGRGVAVSSCVCGADCPEKIVRLLNNALDEK